MQAFPHLYLASATAETEGVVTIASPQLPSLETTPPPQYGGESGYWSPETLLTAAVANCFVLTFRAVARASGLEWRNLGCKVEGTLEKVDRSTQFTHFEINVELRIDDPGERATAERCLEKAERGCLVTSSLRSGVTLLCTVETTETV